MPFSDDSSCPVGRKRDMDAISLLDQSFCLRNVGAGVDRECWSAANPCGWSPIIRYAQNMTVDSKLMFKLRLKRKPYETAKVHPPLV